MKTEIVKVTPAIAESWLKKNVGNRTLNEKIMADYQRDMVAGTWKDNGETIKFDKRGMIIDGQHRLWALIRAKVTLNMIVVTGLDPEVFDTIDIGRGRSAANALERYKVANHERVAKALAVVKGYDKGIRSKVRANIRPNEILGELAIYPDMPEALESLGKAKSKLIPRSVFDALFYIFRRLDPVMATEYMAALRDGTGVEQVPVWHTLRERLIVNATSMNKMNHVKVMALVIKGWNLARRGSTSTILLWTPDKEGFPEVL